MYEEDKEEPEFEIPVCKRIVERYNNRTGHKPIADLGLQIADYNNKIINHQRH